MLPDFPVNYQILHQVKRGISDNHLKNGSTTYATGCTYHFEFAKSVGHECDANRECADLDKLNSSEIC